VDLPPVVCFMVAAGVPPAESFWVGPGGSGAAAGTAAPTTKDVKGLLHIQSAGISSWVLHAYPLTASKIRGRCTRDVT